MSPVRGGSGFVRAGLAAALIVSLGLPVWSLEAQRPPDPNPFPFGGASLRVSVLTIGPGNEVFERFGHNAIRIQDGLTGMDLAYNWGMFSFKEPNFLGRFLSGDTRYWVEAFPTTWMIESYVAEDREITEQVLALTEEQRTALAALVVRSAQIENRYYRYDYFRDNCSTRVRDMIDSVLAGSLERRFAIMTTDWTYRSEAVRLTTPDAFAQAGIELALGPRADVPMTAWESMFIPMRLRDDLRHVTVPGADGTPVPLVMEEALIYKATRAAEPAERRGLTLGAWGPILGAWMLIFAPLAVGRRAKTRIPAAVMSALWYGVTGIVGTLILAMWLGSAHVFWYRNLNLLLVSPIGLVAMVAVTRSILRGEASKLARWSVLAILIQALLAVLLALGGPQRLAGPLLLLLPAHLGMIIAYGLHTKPVPPTTAAAAG